jgi:hypothetical protein
MQEKIALNRLNFVSKSVKFFVNEIQNARVIKATDSKFANK